MVYRAFDVAAKAHARLEHLGLVKQLTANKAEFDTIGHV
jgi:hypothetical protein